jgi:hypothetical protein
MLNVNQQKKIVSALSKTTLHVESNPSTTWTFDRVISPEDGQLSVYEWAGDDLVNSFCDGFNATILAYGQTASGKTWTMTGDLEDQGVIPRAIKSIFEKIGDLAARGSGTTYSFTISYVEIYHEEFIDLLAEDFDNRPIIQIMENKGNISCSGLREVRCFTALTAPSRELKAMERSRLHAQALRRCWITCQSVLKRGKRIRPI